MVQKNLQRLCRSGRMVSFLSLWSIPFSASKQADGNHLCRSRHFLHSGGKVINFFQVFTAYIQDVNTTQA